ncbi:type II toxin-antitoxin system PemK/MazF family toxin [Caldinitratiruptor microaerophilus]|uniref:mRNA interferase n=1 Tax=Caldinitratiruptor microaerophilus TaxID=671077 RepID=A0AA35CJM2_9FIRM|nr:type II toxin-antitoxin system PemK/MazF family toxin [Caldinitratiruptor microaerophilus]BDG60322.1 mRNA interferase [Caldinitratiruptor microaerophilus]
MKQPHRGEVWLVDLDAARGHEQAGKRRRLVVSIDLFNRGPAELVVMVSMTSRAKGIPWHVPVHPPQGGVQQISFIKCEDVRSVAKERLSVRLGAVSVEAMAAVGNRLRILLGLWRYKRYFGRRRISLPLTRVQRL